VRTRYDRRGLWLVALYGLVLLAHTGHAAMRKLHLEEIARQADTIALGTVTHQESAWDAHYTAIHTDVTVAVERAIVGSPGEEVTFRIAGGIVGSMSMRTSVDPVVRDGERVLVFLDTSAVPASVVGLRQGTCPVQDNMVTVAGETWPLEDFIAAIRTVMR
jgi:hypothetical protein